MEKAKAVERVNDLDLFCYPHIDKKSQKKVHKDMYQKALADEDKKARIVTFADLKKNGFSNGR